MGALTSNLGEERARHYSNFRGVDFSSDHTQVHPQRLAYLINMYKDYQSGQGQALETVPGFRKRAYFNLEEPVYGIHNLKHKDKTYVFVHVGDKLYYWKNYPYNANIKETGYFPMGELIDNNHYLVELKELDQSGNEQPFNIVSIVKAKGANGRTFVASDEIEIVNKNKVKITTQDSTLAGTMVQLIDYVRETGFIAYNGITMNKRDSQSFYFNNRLYIKDGKNFLWVDVNTENDSVAIKDVLDVFDDEWNRIVHIPFCYSNTTQDSIGTMLEPRSLVGPYSKQGFRTGDKILNENGEPTENYIKEFILNIPDLEELDIVKVEDCTGINPVEIPYTAYTLNNSDNKITLTLDTAITTQKDNGLIVTINKKVTNLGGIDLGNYESIIHSCTLCATFDGRVFYAGAPDFPNHVFFSRINSTGYVDPTYVGIADFIQDGVSDSKITGLIAVGNSLCVLKEDTQGQDGSVYYHPASAAMHEGFDNNGNATPVQYPYEQGLAGLGCLNGACWNFVDDPVFISKLGLKGVSKMSLDNVTTLKSSIEHRSSLIDAKLVNSDLTKAKMTEWNGYLVILVDGDIYLADSRQRYMDETNTLQYEWYYLSGIGVFKEQYDAYYYSHSLEQRKPEEGPWMVPDPHSSDNENLILEIASDIRNSELDTSEDWRGTLANPPIENAQSSEFGNTSCEVYSTMIEYSVEIGTGAIIQYKIPLFYAVKTINKQKRAFRVEAGYNKVGGKFKAATIAKTIEGNLFFGTENGYICSFNTDLRLENGEIPVEAYSFDGRTIISGCATIMDNCGIPHLNKNTVKKSTIIKTRSFRDSSAKVRVRTNKIPYKQIARINASLFSFQNLNFADFTFNTIEQSIFVVKEKEKKWVEKQYFIYADEYQKPFSLYSISFRYAIAGRIK
jgi:hypothetical protein